MTDQQKTASELQLTFTPKFAEGGSDMDLIRAYRMILSWHGKSRWMRNIRHKRIRNMLAAARPQLELLEDID